MRGRRGRQVERAGAQQRRARFSRSAKQPGSTATAPFTTTIDYRKETTSRTSHAPKQVERTKPRGKVLPWSSDRSILACLVPIRYGPGIAERLPMERCPFWPRWSGHDAALIRLGAQQWLWSERLNTRLIWRGWCPPTWRRPWVARPTRACWSGCSKCCTLPACGPTRGGRRCVP